MPCSTDLVVLKSLLSVYAPHETQHVVLRLHRKLLTNVDAIPCEEFAIGDAVFEGLRDFFVFLRIFSKVCQEFGAQGKKKRNARLSLTAERQPQGEGDQNLDIPFPTPHPKLDPNSSRKACIWQRGRPADSEGDVRNIVGTHVRTVFQFFNTVTSTVQVLLTGCICRLLSLTCSCTTLLSINLIPFFDICSVDLLAVFQPGCSAICYFATLLGPLRRNTCCLWFWQLVFGV